MYYYLPKFVYSLYISVIRTTGWDIFIYNEQKNILNR